MSSINSAAAGSSDELSETGSLEQDIQEQADNLDAGLTSMPIDAAVSSIDRWQTTLSALGLPGVEQVLSGLKKLSAALSDGKPDGNVISPILRGLAQNVGTVAAQQGGLVGTGLKALSGSLSTAANQLNGGQNM